MLKLVRKTLFTGLSLLAYCEKEEENIYEGLSIVHLSGLWTAGSAEKNQLNNLWLEGQKT